MDDARIREALGESINPHYVRALLAKSTPDLLRWLTDTCIETGRTTMETLEIDQRGVAATDGAYRLGLRILDGRLALMKFILDEIASRADAVESTAETDEPAR